ncbi:MAG: molecular chaperone HtpG [Betaproteobacteria bacterium]|nr:molecular chaperone HtpG [Betaproteobacteria bacterium]
MTNTATDTVDAAKAAATAKETLSFQTEVKQLLQLMIHSLYSNKEIFLRELISNASDAADKLRFESVTQPALLGEDADLKVRVTVDREARTLTIADNGIGMSREDVIANIGTIARSGTREFFKSLTGDQAKDAHLIGQFGVGFYSAFIVADRVTLITRRAGLAANEAVRWESDGAGEFTLEAVEKPTRGTEVTLHLKSGDDDFLDDWRVKSVIRKYSDHIQIPVLMKGDGEAATEEAVNRASALWTRPRNDISADQYEEFYKHVAHDWESPLTWVHAKVEGKQEYTQLLYIPGRAPFDLFDRDRKHGVKLYVRRVFIMEDAEQLLPRYLRFVKGVVDSNDLPLNVSREILQESRDVDTIRAGCTKKALGMLEELAQSDNAANKEKFATFWKHFGRVFKEGIAEDTANRDRIAKLCRFVSTASEGDAQDTGFADYIARMKPGQDKLYYVTADTLAAARNSPHLEVFKKKGVEVLLLAEPVDEWWLGMLEEFEGKKLASVAKGDLDLGALADESEKKAQDAISDELKPLIEKMQTALGERVKAVRVTHRLTESPACLVVDENELSGNLERLLKAAGQKVDRAAPTLEINPDHPLVRRLESEIKGDSEDARFADWALVLFDQALLAEGGQLDDPAGFVKRLNSLILSSR